MFWSQVRVTTNSSKIGKTHTEPLNSCYMVIINHSLGVSGLPRCKIVVIIRAIHWRVLSLPLGTCWDCISLPLSHLIWSRDLIWPKKRVSCGLRNLGPTGPYSRFCFPGPSKPAVMFLMVQPPPDWIAENTFDGHEAQHGGFDPRLLECHCNII